MAGVMRILKWGAGFLALWLIYQVAFMAPPTRDLWALAWSKARQGEIGVGIPGENRFDFSAAGLEPGDLLIGGNPGCSWGRFTHAAIYVGNGQVVDTLLRFGVHLNRADRFAAAYQYAGVLKVNAPREQKERAVQVALSMLGRPFNLLSGRLQDRWVYCTKVAWYAHYRAGLDLDPEGGYWVVPDAFLDSPYITATTSLDAAEGGAH